MENNQRDEYRPLFGSGITDKPLFGVSNTRDKVVNSILGCVTALLFVVTLISSFVVSPLKGLNVYFAFCISLICISHVLLIFWYRQGDLDPKFRALIYYNAVTIILLSICALILFFS